jgi:hypothetical protein
MWPDCRLNNTCMVPMCLPLFSHLSPSGVDMAQDFSDPLTSAVYASSKTETIHDPLLAPSPTAVEPKSAKVNASFDSDPLSSPSVNKPQIRTAPSVRHKTQSLGSTKTVTTGSIPGRLSHLSSSSTPSSPLSHPFSDPLDSRNSDGDNEKYKRQGYPKEIDSSNDSTVRPRSAFASFPATAQPPTVADSPSSNTPRSSAPVMDATSSPKSISSPLRQESSYDQQRVKAPQFLHITVSDTDRRGKDGMFVLSAQVIMGK